MTDEALVFATAMVTVLCLVLGTLAYDLVVYLRLWYIRHCNTLAERELPLAAFVRERERQACKHDGPDCACRPQ